MLRTPRSTKETNSGSGTDVKNSTAAATSAATPNTNKWQPLRSARKATVAVLRGQNQGKEQAPTRGSGTRAPAPQTAGSSVISSTSLAKGVQGKLDYSDSFSFAPMSLTVPADFVPISSCDDIEPPSFERSPNIKMSSNFSKLLSNAKKVDQVRHNAKMDTLRSVMDPDKSVDELQKEVESSYAQLQQKQSEASQSTSTVVIGEVEKTKVETLSVEESQKRLIEQLKQGLNYIAKENKQLQSSKTELEEELKQEKAAYVEKLYYKHKEVEERNLKLAVLEAHFRQLNSDAMNEDQHSPAIDEDESPKVKIDENSIGKIDDAEAMADGEKIDDKQTEKKVPSPVKQTAISSIIQIDKGYYNDLEDTAKRETAQRKQVEEFNRDMVAKYNQLVKDSGNEVKELKEKISKQDSVISSLQQNEKKMRLSKYQKKGKAKQSKGHRRHATVSAVPSDDQLLLGLDEQDEHSMSASSNAFNDEASKADESIKKEEAVNIDKAIEAAVLKAVEAKEKEHSYTMEVLSQQLELKDKIISRQESKILGAGSSRPVSKDYMLRNISMTNELMDTSIRQLETMLTRLEHMDDNDQLTPIKRMAQKVSSVHNEMKVAMKHIELRVENNFDKIRSSVSEGNQEKEDKHGGQTSGEGVESSTSRESIEDLIANVHAEATKALKESELFVKKEIDRLKNQLDTFELDMAEKADTIEALELACTEHEKKFAALQEQYEKLQTMSDS